MGKIEELQKNIKESKRNLKEEIQSQIKAMIDKYGEKQGNKHSWFIFDYCTEYGFYFLNSTIDEVIYYENASSIDSIIIAFNSNENDTEYLDSYNFDAMYQFYKMLKSIEEIILKEKYKDDKSFSEIAFINRLKDYGLYDEWEQDSEYGLVGIDTGREVIIFSSPENKEHFEIHYPSIKILLKDKQFRESLKKNFEDNGQKFDENIDWNNINITPIDVYYTGDEFISYFINYEDFNII